MVAYYNENDPKAAAWLRELIRCGHIAKGEVDERSIVDVQPNDLRGFDQCHFFAGIGVWSYALRRAGWADSRPVWTGSCPCQPFSAAGKGDEFADERHLWPAWFRLIRECRPITCFGEQVASKDALAWLDHVSTDLEGEGYAFGAVDTCAAGFGAPHIRQRLYFVADALRGGAGYGPGEGVGAEAATNGRNGCVPRKRLRPWLESPASELADSAESRRPGTREHDGGQPFLPARPVEHGDMGNTKSEQDCQRSGWEFEQGNGWQVPSRGSSVLGATNGFWRNAEWIACRDGKARPVKSGTSPLAHGVANRVVKLRGLGNAINAVQAQEFIEAYMDIELARRCGREGG